MIRRNNALNGGSKLAETRRLSHYFGESKPTEKSGICQVLYLLLYLIYTTATVQPSSMDAGTQPLRDASGLLQAITNFEFVVTFVIGYLYLSHVSALTTKLQRKSNDTFFTLLYFTLLYFTLLNLT